MKGNKIVLKDEMGGWATITVKNVYQSNGVIHVIDHVVDAEIKPIDHQGDLKRSPFIVL